jgi:hypothetical protein
MAILFMKHLIAESALLFHHLDGVLRQDLVCTVVGPIRIIQSRLPHSVIANQKRHQTNIDLHNLHKPHNPIVYLIIGSDNGPTRQ